MDLTGSRLSNLLETSTFLFHLLLATFEIPSPARRNKSEEHGSPGSQGALHPRLIRLLSPRTRPALWRKRPWHSSGGSPTTTTPLTQPKPHTHTLHTPPGATSCKKVRPAGEGRSGRHGRHGIWGDTRTHAHSHTRTARATRARTAQLSLSFSLCLLPLSGSAAAAAAAAAHL